MFSSTKMLLLIALIAYSCNRTKEEYTPEAEISNTIPYTIKATFAHDEEAFTQGLVYHHDKVFESTGMEGSWIAEIDLDKGTQEKKVTLDKEYFGEGITVLNDKLYQLTWKHKRGFIYDVNTFAPKGSFAYDFEGWGLTTDGTHLIISDGSDKLYYLDTAAFNVVKTLSVSDKGRKLKNINELEFAEGFIYANVWETNHVVKIDTGSAQVVGKLDLSPLAKEIKRNYPKADVLNGIAYNPKTKDFLVTGKRWPRAYLLRLDQ